MVPTGQVLLAEATCASLFGTFDSEFYRNIRVMDAETIDKISMEQIQEGSG